MAGLCVVWYGFVCPKVWERYLGVRVRVLGLFEGGWVRLYAAVIIITVAGFDLQQLKLSFPTMQIVSKL